MTVFFILESVNHQSIDNGFDGVFFISVKLDFII